MKTEEKRPALVCPAYREIDNASKSRDERQVLCALEPLIIGVTMTPKPFQHHQSGMASCSAALGAEIVRRGNNALYKRSATCAAHVKEMKGEIWQK